jgi:glutamyl-tRNA synthetase
MSAVTVRFAPSPTGRLHIGNARTALINALFARKAGGRFVLRLDDTDRERSTPAFAAGIDEDVAWLGIVPDVRATQSERADCHAAATERLKAMGRLYPAYESEEDLDYRRKRQVAMGKPPVYDRAALKLTPADRARLEAEGRRPHWRFRLDARIVEWTDLVLGPQRVDCASLSDPVLVRADGTWLYTLPSVVDDIELGITHVIRGADHVTNTGVQIQIFEALGGPVPAFGHHNLLTLLSGEGLSKRLGHLSLKGLRETGYEAMAVASLAVLTGTSQAVQSCADLDALAGLLDLAGISHSAAKFDPAELDGLNARLMHHLDYGKAADRLSALGISPALWEAVRGNVTRLADAAIWRDVVEGPLTAPLSPQDAAFAAASAAHLPQEPFGPDTWSVWTQAVKTATGRKGRDLFLPLRRALTGRDDGPELKMLLPLIGRAAALARLQRAV